MSPPEGSAGRRELGDFLRARRSAIKPEDVGVPPIARGRSTGLRREDVSSLSSVSVTWYTWLEQGRDINPSRQVLDAISDTLKLTAAERTYVLALAGHDSRTVVTVDGAAPAHVVRLLDALTEYPAFALRPDWAIAGWNAAYHALYPGVADLDGQNRNLLWSVFTDPYVRALLPDWDVDSRRFLAEFRAQSGHVQGDRAVRGVVERLRDASPEFREGWDSHDVEGFASRERVFDHPIVGELRLEHHQVVPMDQDDLSLVIYLPVAGTDAATKLRSLVG